MFNSSLPRLIFNSISEIYCFSEVSQNTFLTTRLIPEIPHKNEQRFKHGKYLYRRLRQLEEHGYLKREKFLLSGEYYYYLTKKGALLLQLSILPRFTKPIPPILHAHEYETTRFWLKFQADAQKLEMELLDFYRDGEFLYDSPNRRLIPDGMALLKIRGKAHVFCLELDQGTQNLTVIKNKLISYRRFFRHWREHHALRNYSLGTVRVIFVTTSEERKLNIVSLARKMKLSDQFLFTTQSQYLDISHPHRATGWKYRKVNLFAGNLFSKPSRAPPTSLL